MGVGDAARLGGLDGRAPHPALAAPLRRRPPAARRAGDSRPAASSRAATSARTGRPSCRPSPGYVSQFGTLDGVAVAQPVRRAELLPYVSTKLTRAPVEAGNPFARATALQRTAGLDLRLGVTQDLTLTGDDQSRLRPGRGRSVGGEPHRRRVVLRRAAALLPRGERPVRRRHGEPCGGWGARSCSTRAGWAARRRARHRTARSGSPVPAAASVLGALKLTGRTRQRLEAGRARRAHRRRARTVRGRRRCAVLRGDRAAHALRRRAPDARVARRRDVARLEPHLRRSRRDRADAALERGRRRCRRAHAIRRPQLHRVRERAAKRRPRIARGDARDPAQHDAPLPAAGCVVRRGGLRPHLAHRHLGVLRITKEGGGHTRGGVLAKAVTPGFEANDLGLQPRADAIGGALWLGLGRIRADAIREELGHVDRGVGRQQLRRRSRSARRAVVRERHPAQLLGAWPARCAQRAGLEPDRTAGRPRAARFPATCSASSTSRPIRGVRSSAASARAGTATTTAPGRRLSLTSTISARIGGGTQLSVAPSLSWWRNPQQFVASPTRSATRTHYVVGDLLPVDGGADAARELRALVAPHAPALRAAVPERGRIPRARRGRERRARATFGDRVRLFAPDALGRASDDQLEARTPSGTLRFDRPTIRWPSSTRMRCCAGSTARARRCSWCGARADRTTAPPAPFGMGSQARDLFAAPATNVVLVKVSHWMGR